jgi:hypothetical protein
MPDKVSQSWIRAAVIAERVGKLHHIVFQLPTNNRKLFVIMY